MLLDRRIFNRLKDVDVIKGTSKAVNMSDHYLVEEKLKLAEEKRNKVRG